MPLSLQAKLLRVLQNRTFERVGASESMQVDVRIIAATNRNLEKLVARKQVPRGPLLPPERASHPDSAPARAQEDIPLLAEFFLRKHSRETKKQIQGFTDEAMEELLSYSWPGNVRELENAMERAVVFCPGRDRSDPSSSPSTAARIQDGDSYSEKTLREALNIFKKHFITKALEANGWHQTRTAKALAIQRSYLSKLVRELGIMKERGV